MTLPKDRLYYPIETETPWVRNQWYFAARSQDVVREILSRTILDDPLIFYRTEAGEAVALWGLCPHRLLPLEMGKLNGDNVTCGYHGITFDKQGAAVAVPTAAGASAQCRLRSYSLIERGGLIWIWMGDRTADPALLPDLTAIGFGDDRGPWFAEALPPIPLKARAPLLMDNLLDLSHLAFVHARSTPAAPSGLAEPEVVDSEYMVMVRRVEENVAANPMSETLFPGAGSHFWTQNASQAYSPYVINTAFGPWHASEPDGSKGRRLGQVNFLHLLTPETPNTTHYTAATSFDFRTDDEGFCQMLVQGTHTVVHEDVAILEAIERVADKYGDVRREVSVRPDTGALRLRRLLRQMINYEQGRAAVGT